MLRSAPLFRRGALLIRGLSRCMGPGPAVHAPRGAAPRPGHESGDGLLRSARNDSSKLEVDMKRFNLSAWAVSHPALVLFLVVALGVAGFFSYQKLGRAEDPLFTVKVGNVSGVWAGATANEMQTQVADPIEKKLQELPYFEKVQTYSKPGFAA